MNFTNVFKMLSKIKIKPTTMMYGGMAIAAVGTVAACASTLKLGDIIEDHVKRMEIAKKEETEETIGRRTIMEYGRTFIKVGTLYVAPLAIIVIGNAMMHKGFVDIKSNNIALAAALTSKLDELTEYRSRVKGKIGDEAEELLYNGCEKITDKCSVTDIQTGKTKTEKITKVVQKDRPLNSHAFLFDESNPNYEKGHLCNFRFVKSQLNHAQDKLDINGSLCLNEFLDLYGQARVDDGYLWIWPKTQPDGSRTIIDIGLNDPQAQGFRDGAERCFWVNPKGLVLAGSAGLPTKTYPVTYSY